MNIIPSLRRFRAFALSVVAMLSTMQVAAADYTFISEQPAGEVSYYDRVSLGWYIFAGGNNLQYGPIPGASKIVWADDGAVYIQDPLTANKMGTYIQAERVEDKIVAHFPQVLGEIEDNEGKRPLYIGVMKQLVDDKGLTYIPTTADDHVTWTIHDDGTITMDHDDVQMTAAGKFADIENMPDDVLGTYYYGIDDATGEYSAIWNAVADWKQTYTPIEREEILTIPEGLNIETWRMTTKKGTKIVDVAFDGDVIYFGNLTQYAPGAIKGYLHDGKAIFPTNQCFGFNETHNTNVWFISAFAVYEDPFGFGTLFLSRFDRTDALEFDYDPEAKTLRSAENACFLVNASTGETNYYEYVVDPNLQYLPAEGMNAAPVFPVIINPGEDKGTDGYLFSVDIPAENVDGVALNTNRMFYNIYLNGELWEMNRDTYTNFNASYTDIPYNYTDKYDLVLSGTQHDLYFHEEGIRSIGIESCFLGDDGVVYRSGIVTAGTLPATADSDTEDCNLEETTLTAGSVTPFTYASDGVKTEPSGTGKRETYDVAIALTNPALVGKAITKIEVPVLASKKVSGLEFWLAKELQTKLVDGKLTNIAARRWPVEMPETGGQQTVALSLPRPIVIPEGGLYVGYSLTVDEIDRSEAVQVPIVTALNKKEGGFFIRTSRSYLEWKDRSEEFGVVAMTKVELAGDFHVNAATLGAIPYSYLPIDEQQTVSIPVYNIGQTEISSLQYTSTAGGSEYSGSIDLPTPIPAVYAYYENVDFLFPAVGALGETEISVSLTGVNGEQNAATTETTATGTARVLKFVPVKRGVVEEFTGTWCGWCPAGFVAMEKMAELDPEFIGIAYHDTDPMAMRGGYPNLPSGFPEAAFNREFTSHPYTPIGFGNAFTLPEAWGYLCEGFSPVGISLSAELDADGIVHARSKVEWVAETEDEEQDYRVEYVLLADGLTGNTQGWAQKNYFSTEPVMWDYMEQFWHKDSYVRGLEFNDVAILTSGKKGVSGSIQSCEPGVENEYEFCFNLADAVTPDGTPIPYHIDRLRVVAFILHGSDLGTVVNAAKCNVDHSAGIEMMRNAALNQQPAYNLQGQRVGAGYKGIAIKNGRKNFQK